jgi:hypothetical protein
MHLGSRAWRCAACDVVVAVAAVLTIVASFRPWFQATLTSTGGGTEGLPAPSGSATGVYAHPSVWAAVGLAAAEIALLATRYYPKRRLRVPGDDLLLAIASGLMLPLVTADVLLIPGPWAQIMTPVGVPFPWEGSPYPLDGATLVMTWSYGATVAVTAAIASLAAAIASLVVTRRAPSPDPALVLGSRSPA